MSANNTTPTTTMGSQGETSATTETRPTPTTLTLNRMPRNAPPSASRSSVDRGRNLIESILPHPDQVWRHSRTVACGALVAPGPGALTGDAAQQSGTSAL